MKFLEPYMLWVKLALFALVFIAGWSVKGWKDDADEAKQQHGVQLAVDAFHDHEAKVSGILEDTLSRLKANRTIVEKQHETFVDRPVYSNVCLDADGVRLIDAARRGAAPASEPASVVP